MSLSRLHPLLALPRRGIVPVFHRFHLLWLSGAGVLLLCLSPMTVHATGVGDTTTNQTVTQRASSRADTTARKPEPRKQPTPPQIAESRPSWKELTPAQQTALQPLAPYWDRMAEKRKQKWLLISKNYPRLDPTEQAKLHTRMSEWASFSQRQRSQARQVYRETKNLTAEQKAEQWRAYQALSAEEKKRLAVSAGAIPVGATAIKSHPSPKLATVPFTRRHDAGHNAKVETGTHAPSPRSLLNRQADAPRDPVPSNPYEDDDEDQP